MMIIEKLLIVNCGEIVVCIIYVCCDMGISLVVLYVDDDMDSMYVELVDEVWGLVGVIVCEIYLNILVIFEVVKKFKVIMVYLGYGFLFECVEFVQVVIDVGLKWVGLLLSVIEKLGDKIEVCKIVVLVGVFLV